jgi:hypothetical protein
MDKPRIFNAALRGGVLTSTLLVALLFPSVAALPASAATKSPAQLFQAAMGNAGQKKFVVINMTGTNAAGNYHDVWHSNPNSGSEVESVQHAGATGHVYITVLDRVVYEKIDTVQWAYAGLGKKYKSLEDKWFIVRKSSSSYKSFVLQNEIYGALLIPINGTQFTIQENTVLHGVKVFGLEGALTGSNPAIPVTLIVSKGQTPLPIEISVPRTAKNKDDVWTATFAFRTTASSITKPATTLAFP